MTTTYNAHCPECLGVIPVRVTFNLAGTPDSGPGLKFRIEVTDIDLSAVANHRHADPPFASKGVARIAHATSELDRVTLGAGAAATKGAEMAQKFVDGLAGARPPVSNAAYNIHVTNNPTRRPWWKFWA
jgi:hypothetical protein